ncbi:DsbA family protein [Hyperthermus butylicus]|uniref:Thioredoxin-like fold domain-containing protein n=1 Tax=Hyperthermus butylicus (strain DSM 5456 / JCM 9403 / PLM1-5) TaxID=415426 RepID=A2BJ78_HYPBU|nr:thioredoxin domain-containing protein [Hyperthermus butylicus]ABM80039.1 hypothetical protein Hbut_0167 [Hyperthermus butylicus DSM 5456]
MVKPRRSRRHSILLVAGVLAVVVGVVAMFMTYFRGGGGSAEFCLGDGPAVAVVYVDGQEKLAEELKRYLELQLAGHISGARYCTIEASKFGDEFRVYPVILVKAQNISSQLASILLNTTVKDGWRPVRLDYTAAFAAQIAVQLGVKGPVYRNTATLLVVDGSTPFTKVNVSALKQLIMENERYHVLFSAIFTANITDVKVVEEPPDGVEPVVRPAFYAVSQADLSEGAPALREVAPSIYETDVNIAAMIAGSPVLDAFESRELPKGLEAHPSLGSGPVHIAIFEDFACPYCALFYKTVFPGIEKYIENNTVTFHVLDLIIHNNENVVRIHKLLLCYYNATGNSEVYLEEARRIYSELMIYASEPVTGNKTFYDRLGEIAAELASSLNASADCSAASLVDESTREALRLGLTGTPSFAVWSENSSTVIYFVGYRPLDYFRELITWFLEHSR